MKTTISKCNTTRVDVVFDEPIKYGGNAIYSAVVTVDEQYPVAEDEGPVSIDVEFRGRRLTTKGSEDQRQPVSRLYGIHSPWRYLFIHHVLDKYSMHNHAMDAWHTGIRYLIHDLTQFGDDEETKKKLEHQAGVKYASMSNEVLDTFFGVQREVATDKPEPRASKPRIAHVTGPEVDKVIDAITRGTTNWRDRRNPKVLRCLHITDKYALVEFKGGTYHCHGPNYVNGHVGLVRIPQDLSTAGSHDFWEVTGISTKRCEAKGTHAFRAWLALLSFGCRFDYHPFSLVTTAPALHPNATRTTIGLTSGGFFDMHHHARRGTLWFIVIEQAQLIVHYCILNCPSLLRKLNTSSNR